MTEKRLRTQVSKAGRRFIDGMTEEIPYKKWFATQTIIDDKKVGYLIYLIDYYNKVLDRWTKGGMTNEVQEERVQNYSSLLLGALNILRDIAYYDPNEYGDIDYFITYCWNCWGETQPIDFKEYERIRRFYDIEMRAKAAREGRLYD